MIGTVTSQGQVSIPAKLRKQFNIKKGDKVTFMVNHEQQLVLEKEPTKSDWDNLFANYPTEVVNIDNNGKYDKEKSPNFHEWMVND